jgi:hypothetical protein
MRHHSSSTVISFLLLLFAIKPSFLYCQQPVITTSICEVIAHPIRFDGRQVKLRAKYSGTFEGTWLTDSRCNAMGELMLPYDHNLATVYGVDDLITKLSTRYGINDVVRDQAWEQFEFSSRRLYTGLTEPTAKCFDFVAGEFYGIIAVKRNFRVKNGFGNGWGHLGMSRFLLILRSVSNVSPHHCAAEPGDAPPGIPEFLQQSSPESSAPASIPR